MVQKCDWCGIGPQLHSSLEKINESNTHQYLTGKYLQAKNILKWKMGGTMTAAGGNGGSFFCQTKQIFPDNSLMEAVKQKITFSGVLISK